MARGHEMRLNAEAYDWFIKGSKRIELRLYDEKRKSIKIGDIIKFNKRDYSDYFEAKVIGLLRYNNFSELLDDIKPSRVSKSTDTKEDVLKELSNFYTKEEEEKYGVIGIRVQILNKDKTI